MHEPNIYNHYYIAAQCIRVDPLFDPRPKQRYMWDVHQLNCPPYNWAIIPKLKGGKWLS